MTCVRNVIVRLMIFEHENLRLDLTVSSKAKLYKDGKLVFMGDGYKAILAMISGSQNPDPVRFKFSAQLHMREKPKFSKGDDLEALRKQALASHAQQELVKNTKKKSKKTNQWQRLTK